MLSELYTSYDSSLRGLVDPMLRCFIAFNSSRRTLCLLHWSLFHANSLRFLSWEREEVAGATQSTLIYLIISFVWESIMDNR